MKEDKPILKRMKVFVLNIGGFAESTWKANYQIWW
jgi:hypothetical protein